MKKLINVLEFTPGWVYVVGFFTAVAITYILLNHFYGFYN